jgi:hypothetical protein
MKDGAILGCHSICAEPPERLMVISPLTPTGIAQITSPVVWFAKIGA